MMVGENDNDFISKNQKKSVLITSGVGFVASSMLLALMTRRRHESRSLMKLKRLEDFEMIQ
jgi:hypothetical protein